MHQYREPDDPSFPSGDSLRAWFLAVIVPAALGFPPAGQILLAALAGLVALGRLVLGVHYPTDVLSGTGLGLLGAALTLWGWHVIPWL
jgi:undecaprenyl-diphosphatase